MFIHVYFAYIYLSMSIFVYLTFYIYVFMSIPLFHNIHRMLMRLFLVGFYLLLFCFKNLLSLHFFSLILFFSTWFANFLASFPFSNWIFYLHFPFFSPVFMFFLFKTTADADSKDDGFILSSFVGYKSSSSCCITKNRILYVIFLVVHYILY